MRSRIRNKDILETGSASHVACDTRHELRGLSSSHFDPWRWVRGSDESLARRSSSMAACVGSEHEASASDVSSLVATTRQDTNEHDIAHAIDGQSLS